MKIVCSNAITLLNVRIGKFACFMQETTTENWKKIDYDMNMEMYLLALLRTERQIFAQL